MKKKNIVKSNILFNDVINNGKKISNKYYVISSLKSNDEQPKFGIAVGKKIGNAVHRNKVKRQIRNIIDHNIELFKNYHYYIIISKKEINELSFNNMQNELIMLLNEKGASL